MGSKSVNTQFWARRDRRAQLLPLRGAVGGIAWIAVASLVVTTGISGIAFFVDENRGAMYVMTLVVGSIPVSAVVWLLALHYFRGEFSCSSNTGLGVTAAGKVALALSVLGGLALAVIGIAMTEAFPPGAALHDSPLAPLVSNGKVVLISWLLSSVLVAPLTEEMFFRGILLGSLSRKWGFLVSSSLSTAAFAVIHAPQLAGYYTALVPIIMLGFAAATARRLFASLWAAIALHASYNLTLSLYGLMA